MASTRFRFQLESLLEIVKGHLKGVYSEGVGFDHISIDSRTILPGELFWAIQGKQHDGHQFVNEAFEKGAVAAVVQQKIKRPMGPLVKVLSTRDALSRFAAVHREKHQAVRIGITGSVGKTTTRQMVDSVLSTEQEGITSPFNFNTEIGVPLGLLLLDSHHHYAVMELGATRKGDIANLSQIVQPQIAIITQIGPAHLQSFKDIKTIAQTKGEILDSLDKDGLAIFNGDDPFLKEVAAECSSRKMFVGENEGNTIQPHNIFVQNRTLSFDIEGDRYIVPVSGHHHLTAALAAVAVGKELGLKTHSIQRGLRYFQPVSGRCAVQEIGSWIVIDDTYNANPISMQAACQLLKGWSTSSQKILVLGDMLDLGRDTEKYHFELGQSASESQADFLITYGDLASSVMQGASHEGMSASRRAECSQRSTLETILNCWLEPGDVVLVKGSRDMNMEQVIQFLSEQVPSTASYQQDKTNGEENSSRLPRRATA